MNALRVVVWNIARKAQAWGVLDELKPDICLLNEARVPAGRKGQWNIEGTLGRDKKKRDWTSAIVTDLPTREITDARPRWRQSERNVPFESSRPGAWQAAQVETSMGLVSVVSLYGLLDEFSDASIHRSLSELSPLLDDRRYKDLVLIGGDLNTGTQWSKADKRWNDRDRNVLDRFAALGLVDCLKAKRPEGRLEGCKCVDGDLCSHTRTRRDFRYPDVAYQTDYLFASAKLASMLQSCQALATDRYFVISDHAPILAEFAI